VPDPRLEPSPAWHKRSCLESGTPSVDRMSALLRKKAVQRTDDTWQKSGSTSPLKPAYYITTLLPLPLPLPLLLTLLLLHYYTTTAATAPTTLLLLLLLLTLILLLLVLLVLLVLLLHYY
jgi:hypothetical protein